MNGGPKPLCTICTHVKTLIELGPICQFCDFHDTGFVGIQIASCPNLNTSWFARLLEFRELIKSCHCQLAGVIETSPSRHPREYGKPISYCTDFSGTANLGIEAMAESMLVPIKPHPHHLRYTFYISTSGPPSSTCYSGRLRQVNFH